MDQAAAFQRRYLRDLEYGATDDIDAVALDECEPPATVQRVVAGWWSEPDRSAARVVLPNPWDRRDGVCVFESWCWDVTEELVRVLTPVLSDLHGVGRDGAYWHRVLAPWLLHLVSGVADRSLFLRVAQAACGPSVPVLGLPEDDPPATTADALTRLRSGSGNAKLMTRLAAGLGMDVRMAPQGRMRDSEAAAVFEPRRSRDPVYLLRAAGRLAIRRAGRTVISGDRGRRVVVVGHSGLRPEDEIRLALSVRGLRFPAGAVCTSQVPPADPAVRALLPRVPPSGDPLAVAVLDALPAVMPRSLLEGFDTVRTTSRQGYGAASSVLVGNYSTDEVQNEFLGRCANAGHRTAFAQHGGFYGQGLVHAQERLEVTAASEFWSWGPRAESGTRTVPSPWLERIRSTARATGEAIVLIEPVHPPDRFLVRFSSVPLDNQTLRCAEMLDGFVGVASDQLRARMTLKRYPRQLRDEPRSPLLAGLPSRGPRGAFGAVDWMKSASAVVVAYPDTPFLEALVIGVPTIGLWDDSHYEWRPELESRVASLRAARIVFHDPRAAADHLDSVRGDVQAWWASSAVAEARAAFLEQLAPAGDWRRGWRSGLQRLATGF